MNHDRARDLLEDYLDGLLPAGQGAEIEDHLQACADCRRELEDLRALLQATASLPRRIEPGHDLWPEIAARAREGAQDPAQSPAEDPVQAESGRRATWREFWQQWRGLWPVFAGTAAVIVIIFSSVMRGVEAPPARPSFADALEAEFSGPARELAAYAPADSAGGGLTDVISENLAIVDRAIADARQAYEANPGSPKLVRLLAAAYRARAALTTRAVETAAVSEHVVG